MLEIIRTKVYYKHFRIHLLKVHNQDYKTLCVDPVLTFYKCISMACAHYIKTASLPVLKTIFASKRMFDNKFLNIFSYQFYILLYEIITRFAYDNCICVMEHIQLEIKEPSAMSELNKKWLLSVLDNHKSTS